MDIKRAPEDSTGAYDSAKSRALVNALLVTSVFIFVLFGFFYILYVVSASKIDVKVASPTLVKAMVILPILALIGSMFFSASAWYDLKPLKTNNVEEIKAMVYLAQIFVINGVTLFVGALLALVIWKYSNVELRDYTKSEIQQNTFNTLTNKYAEEKEHAEKTLKKLTNEGNVEGVKDELIDLSKLKDLIENIDRKSLTVEQQAQLDAMAESTANSVRKLKSARDQKKKDELEASKEKKKEGAMI
jgi:hypothetical protein